MFCRAREFCFDLFWYKKFRQNLTLNPGSLEFTMQSKITSEFQPPFYLCLPTSELTGMTMPCQFCFIVFQTSCCYLAMADLKLGRFCLFLRHDGVTRMCYHILRRPGTYELGCKSQPHEAMGLDKGHYTKEEEGTQELLPAGRGPSGSTPRV